MLSKTTGKLAFSHLISLTTGKLMTLFAANSIICFTGIIAMPTR
ncbi:MAG: hypothetical protein WCX60_02315 [Anaerovoracaceae bacterium]